VKLNAQQFAQFRAFGFCIFRGLFDAAELRVLEDELTRVLTKEFGDAPVDGTARQWTLMTRPETPAHESLLEDPRFLDVAEELYGEDVIGVLCEANRFMGGTGWHPDTVGEHHYGIRFLFYLQPLHAGNGALRVIPGSHHQPLHNEVDRFLREVQPAVDAVPAVVLNSHPGDVIAYDMRLWHASAHGEPGRRAAAVMYYHNPKSPEEIATAQQMDRLSRAHLRDFRKGARAEEASGPGTFVNPMFDERWIENRANSARRARWIARLREIGFLDAPDAVSKGAGQDDGPGPSPRRS